jgi:hypothetical protein
MTAQDGNAFFDVVRRKLLNPIGFERARIYEGRESNDFNHGNRGNL